MCVYMCVCTCECERCSKKAVTYLGLYFFSVPFEFLKMC